MESSFIEMDIVHFLIFQTGLFSPIYVNLSFSLHKIFSFQTCLICSTLKSFSCHWIEVESQVPASDIRGSLFHRTRWNWKLNGSKDQKGAKQERNHPSKAKRSFLMYFYKNSMSLFCPRLQPSDNFLVSCDDDYGSNSEFQTNNEDREIYKSYGTVM